MSTFTMIHTCWDLPLQRCPWQRPGRVAVPTQAADAKARIDVGRWPLVALLRHSHSACDLSPPVVKRSRPHSHYLNGHPKPILAYHLGKSTATQPRPSTLAQSARVTAGFRCKLKNEHGHSGNAIRTATISDSTTLLACHQGLCAHGARW